MKMLLVKFWFDVGTNKTWSGLGNNHGLSYIKMSTGLISTLLRLGGCHCYGYNNNPLVKVQEHG